MVGKREAHIQTGPLFLQVEKMGGGSGGNPSQICSLWAFLPLSFLLEARLVADAFHGCSRPLRLWPPISLGALLPSQPLNQKHPLTQLVWLSG